MPTNVRMVPCSRNNLTGTTAWLSIPSIVIRLSHDELHLLAPYTCEYAYDRDTEFGRLDKALDAATVVDLKADWKQIFPKE